MNMNTTAVIIDDEQAARQILMLYLKNYCPQIELIGTADNFDSGYELLESAKPDVVFLDIELNSAEGGGLELIEKFAPKQFVVIFFTGYDKYVEDSYRLNATYYIKKPISIIALQEAVDRAIKQVKISRINPSFYRLSTLKGIEFIDFKDIMWLHANGAITHLFINSSAKRTSSETLGEIEKKLPPKDFYRVHRSYIVNRLYVREYQKEGFIILIDGTAVSIANGQVKNFLSWFSNLTE